MGFHLWETAKNGFWDLAGSKLFPIIAPGFSLRAVVFVLNDRRDEAMESLFEQLFEGMKREIATIVRETMMAVFREQESRRDYPERVSVAQASEITGYSKNSLYQMHSQGKVPGAHKVGSKLMFDTATLKKWVAQGGNGVSNSLP